MKNRKSWYIVATFVAVLLVTLSVLMPGVLLSKTEGSILGYPYTVSDGTSSSQQHRSNVASTPPTQTLKPVEQLTRSVQLFEQGALNSAISKESTDGSMDIKEAVSVCIKQITTLLQKGALPPLAGFPQVYTVNAELRTITDDHGNSALQYWSISFSTSADQHIAPAKMHVSLDAQTGMFLSIQLSINSTHEIDLVNSAETIAQSMNIPGKMLSLTSQTALWMFNDSSLLMQLTLMRKSSFKNFLMVMSINKKPGSE